MLSVKLFYIYLAPVMCNIYTLVIILSLKVAYLAHCCYYKYTICYTFHCLVKPYLSIDVFMYILQSTIAFTATPDRPTPVVQPNIPASSPASTNPDIAGLKPPKKPLTPYMRFSKSVSTLLFYNYKYITCYC